MSKRANLSLISTAFVGVAVAASAQAAAALSNPTDFVIDTLEADGWELKATTRLRWDYTMPGGERAPDGIPFYASGTCTAKSSQMSFEMDNRGRVAWLSFALPQFRSSEGAIMPERSFDMYLGEDRFELGYGPSIPSKLENFDYPEVYRSTSGFMGFEAYRRSEAEAWRPLMRLFDQLIDAESGWVSLLPLTDERRGADHYAPGLNNAAIQLDLKGLRRAHDWCAATLRSPAARMLPASEGQEN